jgi:hypothetical protein
MIPLLLSFHLLLAVGETRPEQSQSKSIPLSQVWAEGIQGTRDIKEFAKKRPNDPPPKEPFLAGASHPLLSQIKFELTKRYRRGLVAPVQKRAVGEKFESAKPNAKSAGPAFIVTGSGRTALENVLAAFKAEELPRSATQNDDVNVVFYGRLTQDSWHIDSIDVADKQVIIKCHMKTKPSGTLNMHLAMIPLGRLSPGEYEIKVVQGKTQAGLGHQGPVRTVNHVFCSDSSFYITKE